MSRKFEEIFGEISGEFDEEDNLFSKLDDFTFIFDSKINLSILFLIVSVSDLHLDDFSN